MGILFLQLSISFLCFVLWITLFTYAMIDCNKRRFFFLVYFIDSFFDFDHFPSFLCSIYAYSSSLIQRATSIRRMNIFREASFFRHPGLPMSSSKLFSSCTSMTGLQFFFLLARPLLDYKSSFSSCTSITGLQVGRCLRVFSNFFGLLFIFVFLSQFFL